MYGNIAENVYICVIIYIYQSMRKNIISLALLSVVMFTSTGIATASVKGDEPRVKIEEMLERKRWADARLMLNDMREGLDPVLNRFDLEWVDYQIVHCNVELGMSEVRQMMEAYLEAYPSSVYANNMEFMLGSYLIDEGFLQEAKPVLTALDYKALDARQRERYDIRVGYIYFVERDYIAAAEHFKRISRNSDAYPHALYYLSYIDYVEQRYDKATAGFNQLKDHDSYKELIPYYLLQIEYRNSNYDYVSSNGEGLLSAATSEVRSDLVRVMAESYFEKGDYAQAVRYILEYPADLMDRQENYIKGYSLYRLARYREAIEPLSLVCGARDELTQNASYHLGDCYLRIGDKQNAAKAFSMAAVEGFDDAIAEDAMLNNGRLKYELGGGLFNEAVNILQDYLVRYPSSVHTTEVKALLIAAYYNSKDYDAAYNAIKEFPNPDGEIKAALQKVTVFRAVEAVKRGDLAMADELLRESEALAVSPKYTALTYYWQAEVAYLQGDAAAAKQKYNDYVRRAPKSEAQYAMAHYGLGYANFVDQNMKEAEKAFEVFVRDYTKRDDYMYDAHNRLGDARYALREFASARKAYNISYASTSEHREYARYQLALIDGIESKQSSKIDRLKQIVIDNRGEYVDDAWFELGRTYITAERYADGAQTLQEFIDSDTLSPYYVPSLSNLGLAYYNLNRTADARRCYERIVEYDAQSSAALEAMRSIREIYVAEGNIDEYFAYAERSGVQSDMSAAARDSLTFAVAKNTYLDGNRVVATSKLKNYLESFPSGYNRSEALYYLSDCHIDYGAYDEALATMEELLAQGNTTYTVKVLGVYAPLSMDMKRYDKAAQAYRKLYDMAHSVEQRQQASEGYVDATLQYGDNEAVKSLADDIAQMGDATAWAKRHTALRKANILREEGSAAEAQKLYEFLAEDRTTIEGAESYYYLLLDKFNAEEYDAAEQMVYNMGAMGSIYWQAKSFIILGDIFVKNNNTFQARATYQSIVDGYSFKDDGIIEEAQQRINAIN